MKKEIKNRNIYIQHTMKIKNKLFNHLTGETKKVYKKNKYKHLLFFKNNFKKLQDPFKNRKRTLKLKSILFKNSLKFKQKNRWSCTYKNMSYFFYIHSNVFLKENKIRKNLTEYNLIDGCLTLLKLSKSSKSIYNKVLGIKKQFTLTLFQLYKKTRKDNSLFKLKGFNPLHKSFSNIEKDYLDFMFNNESLSSIYELIDCYNYFIKKGIFFFSKNKKKSKNNTKTVCSETLLFNVDCNVNNILAQLIGQMKEFEYPYIQDYCKNKNNDNSFLFNKLIESIGFLLAQIIKCTLKFLSNVHKSLLVYFNTNLSRYFNYLHLQQSKTCRKFKVLTPSLLKNAGMTNVKTLLDVFNNFYNTHIQKKDVEGIIDTNLLFPTSNKLVEINDNFFKNPKYEHLYNIARISLEKHQEYIKKVNEERKREQEKKDSIINPLKIKTFQTLFFNFLKKVAGKEDTSIILQLQKILKQKVKEQNERALTYHILYSIINSFENYKTNKNTKIEIQLEKGLSWS